MVNLDQSVIQRFPEIVRNYIVGWTIRDSCNHRVVQLVGDVEVHDVNIPHLFSTGSFSVFLFGR